MAETSIEWASKVWNPVVGCSVISPGCTNCYAMRMAGRLERMGSPIYKGLTQKTKAGDVWTGRVEASNWGKMIEPLRWKKPERIFVNSMSDLFHENLAEETIDQVFAVMALCPQHTFMVLTKRSARMREYVTDPQAPRRIALAGARMMEDGDNVHDELLAMQWPLSQIWLGVSTEDQERADERVPDLLATPAAIRFVSAEPLLGPIDFRFLAPSETGYLNTLSSSTGPNLDLVITGGESGPGARESWVPNIRSITQQCAAAGVACFNKQMGAFVTDRNDAGFDGCEPGSWHLEDEGRQVVDDPYGYQDAAQGAAVRIKLRDRKGGDMSEWPEDLRVREMPEGTR